MSFCHSLVIFVILALLAVLMSPKIGRNSCARHALGKYFELNKDISCTVILYVLNIFGKKNCVMILLICDSIRFYAHVHICSPSCTEEEQKTNVDSKMVCFRLLIIGLIAPIRLWLLSIAYHLFSQYIVLNKR